MKTTIEKRIEKINGKIEKFAQMAKELAALKKAKYGNIDISEPMSEDEKKLTRETAVAWGEVNSLILKKRELNKKLLNK